MRRLDCRCAARHPRYAGALNRCSDATFTATGEWNLHAYMAPAQPLDSWPPPKHCRPWRAAWPSGPCSQQQLSRRHGPRQLTAGGFMSILGRAPPVVGAHNRRSERPWRKASARSYRCGSPRQRASIALPSGHPGSAPRHTHVRAWVQKKGKAVPYVQWTARCGGGHVAAGSKCSVGATAAWNCWVAALCDRSPYGTMTESVRYCPVKAR